MRIASFLVVLALLAGCAVQPMSAKMRVASAEIVFAEAVRQALNARADGRLVPGTPAYENVGTAIVTGDQLLTQAWQIVEGGAQADDPALAGLLRGVSNVTRQLRLELQNEQSSIEHFTGDRNRFISFGFGPDPTKHAGQGAA